MPHHALDERHELSQTLRGAGAEAPTLCGEWTTAQLAAHLVLRERSIFEMAGRLPVHKFQELAEKRIAEYVVRQPYESIVASLDGGAPWYLPWDLPPLRDAVNLLEYVVHHEDVRRAGADTTPRLIPAGRQLAIWKRLHSAVALTMRGVPVGVRLVWPSHGDIRTLRARHRGVAVTVTGDPVELALLAFGRQRVAHVGYDGSPADVRLVSGATIAI